MENAKENHCESVEKKWRVDISWTAANCKNYIRNVVETLHLEPNPEKSVIAFSIGDPTVYGNLKPSQETLDALSSAIESNLYNGYAPSTGYEESRLAVADYLSCESHQYQKEDIILTSGCSSALEIAITALADSRRNDNILVPRPGFSIYRTLAEAIGVEVKYYDLLPERNWEIDLDHLDLMIDSNTAAVVLNNPSNPCGSVYDEEHLKQILQIVSRHRVPVVADEIYEHLVFPPKKFVSTASLKSQVPILICGGLAKRFLVPGWRLGWIAIHDDINAFCNIRRALISLSQRIMGSNTVVQGAIPGILKTPQTFHDDLLTVLNANATLAYEILRKSQGLIPYMPDGAMYMMVKIELSRFPFGCSSDFATKLMEEESVFCLPGECFQISEFMRIVLTAPEELIKEGCQRITQFCNRYFV